MALLKKLALFFLTSAIHTSLTLAQGIRVNTFCYTNDFKAKVDEDGPTNSFSNWFVGIGYEQNVGNRIAVSLDINSSLGKLFGSESEQSKTIDYYDNNYQFTTSYSINYTSYISYTELNYQSKYFFNDNDDASGYISSGIGLKFVNWTYKAVDGYGSVPPEISYLVPRNSIEEKLLVIPLSLRFGRRGSIDGAFGEYFFGFSYNLKAGNLPQSDELKNFFNEKPMRGFAFNLGYLWGIGWAD